jgi:hypothetical protein
MIKITMGEQLRDASVVPGVYDNDYSPEGTDRSSFSGAEEIQL